MTTSTGDTGAWQRLGTALKQRRVTLDQRFRSRKAFAEATGLDYRLIYDIEESRRTNFSVATLTAIEVSYQLTPGAISRFLGGGDLLPEQPPIPVAVNSARAAGIDPDDLNDPWTSSVREQVEAARRMHGGNPTGSQIFFGTPASSYEAGLWDDRSLNEASRILSIAIIRAYRARDVAGSQNHGRSGRAGLIPALTLARR